MSAGDSTVFESYRVLLEEALSRDADLEDVEMAIDRFALDGEEKAALWLWATAHRDGAGAPGPGRSSIGRLAGPGVGTRRHPAHKGEMHDPLD